MYGRTIGEILRTTTLWCKNKIFWMNKIFEINGFMYLSKQYWVQLFVQGNWCIGSKIKIGLRGFCQIASKMLRGI